MNLSSVDVTLDKEYPVGLFQTFCRSPYVLCGDPLRYIVSALSAAEAMLPAESCKTLAPYPTQLTIAYGYWNSSPCAPLVSAVCPETRTRPGSFVLLSPSWSITYWLYAAAGAHPT